jgi:predicted ATP-grasp superfamily ATP-dependent carboligase
MVTALIRDLEFSPRYRPLILWDADRLPIPDHLRDFIVFVDSHSWLDAWIENGLLADAILPIAPEIENTLCKTVDRLRKRGCHVIASDIDFLTMASDKWATFNELTRIGIDTVPTIRADQCSTWPPTAKLASSNLEWVVKPRFGAGGSQTMRLGPNDPLQLSPESRRDFIIQPFVEGQFGSKCCVAKGNQLDWLPASKQDVRWNCLNNSSVLAPAYFGGTTNAFADWDDELETLLTSFLTTWQTCNDALLDGWIGFDFVLPNKKIEELSDGIAPTECSVEDPKSPLHSSEDHASEDTATRPLVRPFLMEINARLTSSFIGVRRNSNRPLAEFICRRMSDAVHDETLIIHRQQVETFSLPPLF